MTIIEFYDNTPIDNMISCLANRPKKIIFLGERKVLEAQADHFYSFLDEVDNFETVLEFRGINKNSLPNIVDTLSQLVDENEDVCFDLTGGDDLCLVAAGIVFERFRGKGVQLHRYNIRTGKVYDCDCDGKVVSGMIPPVTVEQNILLHGGAIVTAEQKKSGTFFWDLSLDFVRDLNEMWKICRKDCAAWNFQISILSRMMLEAEESEDPTFLCCNLAPIRSEYARRGYTVNFKNVFPDLLRLGLIRDMRIEDGYFSVYFKDMQIRQCLSKAGVLLELKTYLAAMQLEENGDYLFNDGLTGVMLDWDGVVLSDYAVETSNEVDVILMHGLIPIFISCKNGSVDDDELYKLNTVAEHFGGPYAKKVVVATTLGKSDQNHEFFLTRAKDMGITVISDVHNMTDEKFSQAIRSLAFQ